MDKKSNKEGEELVGGRLRPETLHILTWQDVAEKRFLLILLGDAHDLTESTTSV